MFYCFFMSKILKLNTEQIEKIIYHSINEATNLTIKNYLAKNDNIMSKMEKYMKTYGVVMKNIETNKVYLVLDNPSLSNIIGYNMVIARLLKSNEQYGQFVIKPRIMFTLLNAN